MLGTRIMLFGPSEFNDLWLPILVQAECVIVSRLSAPVGSSTEPGNGQPKESLNDRCSPFDYVVMAKENSPSISNLKSGIIQQARRMNVPLCSSLWLIQSLIHGKLLDPLSHPDFYFSYV